MYKKAIKIISFLLITTIIFTRICSVLEFKYDDGVYGMEVFYEQEDNIDVLILGSSHVLMNVNPDILWKEHGMTSYVLAGSEQPIWNSYHYLVEGLKTQKPKLVVLDVLTATSKTEYIDHSRIIKNNYGLDFSKNKIDGLKVSVPPESSFVDYLLEFPTYHSRYQEKDITERDFIGTHPSGYMQKKYFKGYYSMFNIHPGIVVNDLDVTERLPLPEKPQEYLIKIIELCKSNNIPLLLIKSPLAYEMNESEYMIYNTVGDIAQAFNVPFLNYNTDNIANMDFSTDYIDIAHMNFNGGKRLTTHLGDYIKDNYEIPNRSGEEGTESYDVASDMFDAMFLNETLKNEQDLTEMLTLIKDNPGNYELIISANGNFQNSANYNAFTQLLTQDGIDTNKVNEDVIYITSSDEVKTMVNDKNGFNLYKNTTDDVVLSVSRKADADTPVVYLDTVPYALPSNTVCIFVYDKLLETFVKVINTN